MIKDLQKKLKSRWDTFTTSEQKIATHLLQNPGGIPFETAASLGQRVGVSAMTVGRFLRNLGYAGLNELKEELRGDAARPYDSLFRLDVPAASYTTSTYARSPIGSIADLDAATVEDVRAFHAQYYRPDNAVLVVSGNFDTAQLNQGVDKYFGPVARPAWPIPHTSVAEPARSAGRRYVLHAPNTPLPALVLSWQLPPATFSGGEQQRINIARSLIADYPLLLLDEPTASLDQSNRDGVIDLIRQRRDQGTAIVGIFHDVAVRDAIATRTHNGALPAVTLPGAAA